MNYTLPSKLKLFAIILMVLGAVGIGAGFLSAPGSTAEVKEMMAAHGDDHTTSSKESHDSHTDAAHGASHSAADQEKHLEQYLTSTTKQTLVCLVCCLFLFLYDSTWSLGFLCSKFCRSGRLVSRAF